MRKKQKTDSTCIKQVLLFSVTSKDCDWEFFRGPGNGGQKRNKTSNACRCTHRASGAVGKATEARSQRDNRELAFRRMAESEKFRNWVRITAAGKEDIERSIESAVEKAMQPHNYKIESMDENGKWGEYKEENGHIPKN